MDQTPSDEILAQEACYSEAAFGALYDRYADRVYRFALARLQNVDDAEDVAANSFIALFESIDRFRGSGSFASFLFGIARRKIADHFRRRDVEPLESDPFSIHAGPVELFEESEIRDLLLRLAPEKAEIVYLRLFAELPHDEIAELLGKSVTATRMSYSRALAELRRFVEREALL